MRVLMTTNPGLGHVHPMVPFAHALQQAGHEVAFACSASFCSYVKSIGFEALPAGLDWLESESIRTFPELANLTLEEQENWFFTNVFADAAALPMAADLLKLCTSWKPDVMVRNDYEFGACVVAEQKNIPLASISLDLFMPLRFWQQTVGEQMAYLRSAYGLSPYPSLEMLYPSLHFLLAPPAYQPPYLGLTPAVRYVRPIFFDNPDGQVLPEWIQHLPDRPNVYFSLGTVFNRLPWIFKTVIEALSQEDINVIVTIGRNQDPAQFGTMPKNVCVERYLPLSLLFPHCTMAIVHTGFSTLLTGLCTGIPLLVLPLSTNYALLAMRCREIGVGDVLKFKGQVLPDWYPSSLSEQPVEDISAETIRAKVRELLNNPTYAQAAQRLRSEVQSLPGPEQAVTLLSDLVQARL